MSNELKDFLVQSQWKQNKPEDSPAVKQARYTSMLNTIKGAMDKVTKKQRDLEKRFREWCSK
jgi:hypothetical protein